MSLHSAAGQKDGEPFLVIVAEGHSDVGRLLDVLNFGYARCEHAALAAQATRQVRRHPAGRDALRLLKAHGGPDLLKAVPDDKGILKALTRALADPGKIVRREPDEPLVIWQRRAAVATIVPWLASEPARAVANG